MKTMVSHSNNFDRKIQDVRDGNTDEDVNLNTETCTVAVHNKIFTDSEFLNPKQPTIHLGWPEEVYPLEGYTLRLEDILHEAKAQTPIQSLPLIKSVFRLINF